MSSTFPVDQTHEDSIGPTVIRIIIMLKTVITMLERSIFSIVFIFILLFSNIGVILVRCVLVFCHREQFRVTRPLIVPLVSELILLTTISIQVCPWQLDTKLLGIRCKELHVCADLHVGLRRSK